MKQIEARTYITDQIYEKEWEYTYGKLKEEKVDFTFIKIKTGKCNKKQGLFTYKQAIELARMRTKDGRYKNFEFLIG